MAIPSDDWAVRRLNTYNFETIWNGAPGEYTVNISLTQVGVRAVTGTVVLGTRAYGLPDSGLYTVFTLPYRLFSNNQLFAAGTWTTADAVLANVQTLLSVYSATGVALPRGAISLYRDPLGQMALLAIHNGACLKLFPTGVPPLYITAYRNPIITSPISSWSFTLPTPLTSAALLALQAQITACLTQCAIGTLLTVNGYDTDPTIALPTWNPGDYVDLLVDPSVIAAYDAEVGTLNTGYLSTRYAEVRDILHCPKAANPNQWLLTHEASYVSVWNAASRSGVRVPRLDPNCIKQLTHADWSINRAVVQALQTSLQAPTVIARVRVRKPADPHVLQPNSALLLSLYECADTEILEHLLGAIDSAATFWTAAALEQNPYLELLFQTPSGTDATVLSTYRTALGYDQMVAILGGPVQTGLPAAQYLVLDKPFYLYQQSCYAMVFYQGRKLDSALVTQKDLPQGHLGFSIDPSLTISSTNTLDVTIVENAPLLAQTVVNAVAGVIATISSPYASVYEYVTFSTPILGWDGSSVTGGYVEIAAGANSYQLYPATTGSGYEVSINPALAGKTLLVIDDIYVAVNRIVLDPLLAEVAPLIFPLTGTDESSNVIPLLNFGTLEVYINGLRLAPTLDYNLLYWTDPVTGGIGRIDVVLANQSYFDLENIGNRVEFIAHSSVTTSRDVSYVLGQALRHEVTPSFWNNALSRCMVEGVWVDSAVWYTDWIAVTNQPEGGVGYWDTMLHRRLYELMKAYNPTADYAALAVVERILNHITPALPATVVQTSQHHLYSPYLSAIIAAVANGSFTLVDDPDPKMFLQQFSRYAALKAVDPSLATYAGPVNVNYVAIAADYANVTIVSPETEALVQQLISFVLTPSATLGETLI